jgi:hypothetical protein
MLGEDHPSSLDDGGLIAGGMGSKLHDSNQPQSGAATPLPVPSASWL